MTGLLAALSVPHLHGWVQHNILRLSKSSCGDVREGLPNAHNAGVRQRDTS